MAVAKRLQKVLYVNDGENKCFNPWWPKNSESLICPTGWVTALFVSCIVWQRPPSGDQSSTSKICNLGNFLIFSQRCMNWCPRSITMGRIATGTVDKYFYYQLNTGMLQWQWSATTFWASTPTWWTRGRSTRVLHFTGSCQHTLTEGFHKSCQQNPKS